MDAHVVRYADSVTGSMERAMAETRCWREKQEEYNAAHGITPASVKRDIAQILVSPFKKDRVTIPSGGVHEDAKPFLGSNFQTTLNEIESRMRKAAADLEFEEAARLCDELKRLKLLDLKFADEVMTGAGEAVDAEAAARLRREAAEEKAAVFRKRRR